MRNSIYVVALVSCLILNFPVYSQKAVSDTDSVRRKVLGKSLWVASSERFEQFANRFIISKSYEWIHDHCQMGKFARNTYLSVVDYRDVTKSKTRRVAHQPLEFYDESIGWFDPSDCCDDTIIALVGIETLGHDTMWACLCSSACWLSSKCSEQVFYLDPPDVRVEKLRAKYGKFAAGVVFGKIMIGMNAEMVREILDFPSHINRTTTSQGVSEQWVYPDGRYLYFDNGVLTAWQD